MHVFFLGLTTDFYSSVCYCRFLCFITARKRSLGQGNIFSSVCQEFCSQEGGSASVHAWIPPPPRSRHPRTRHTSGADTPLGAATHPLRADTPQSRHPLRSACWEIRSTSGRYASYWNAILYIIMNLSGHIFPPFEYIGLSIYFAIVRH